MRRSWRRSLFVAAALTLLGMLPASCSESEVPSAASEPPDAGAPDTGPVFEEPPGTGTRWSDLYRDIFGPTGRPGSCSFAATCHGSADTVAAKTSLFTCSDEKGCRDGLFRAFMLKPADAQAPEKATLLLVIKTRDASGNVKGIMPSEPAGYVFSPTTLQRVRTWIADGMKDD